MRKFLSIIVTFIILLSSLNVLAIASYSETDCKSLEDFTNEVTNLINNEETLNNESQLISVASVDVEEECSSETKRLIVKSDRPVNPLNSVNYISGYNDLHILQFADNVDFYNAKKYYESIDYIEYVEEDAILKESVINGGEIVTESAITAPTTFVSNVFGYTTAKNNCGTNPVSVAIVDSGVESTHEFLQGRVVPTGFNSVTEGGTSEDDRGHGTQVAGIIVANSNDNVTIYPYKALNKWGEGTALQVSLAIDAAVSDDVDIINLSLSMVGYNETLHQAVVNAKNEGITVVAAAGNKGYNLEITECSPGGFSEVISVVSVNVSRVVSSFSNYGATVSCAAPGEDILSSYLNNTYKISSGTSMSAPFVVAACCYKLSSNSNLSPDQLYSSIIQGAKNSSGSFRTSTLYPGTAISTTKQCATPVFTYSNCTFAGRKLVEITCSTLNSNILYSINGSDYYEYKDKFYVDATSTITAYAVSQNYRPSSSVSRTYTKSLIDSDDFTINGTTLVGYSGSSESVTIPDLINDVAITDIAATAFSNNTIIKTVHLSGTVTSIESGAFKNCSSLESVNGTQVTSLGSEAFYDCKALTTISLSKVKSIGDKTFYNCENLNTASFPASQTVGISAFENTKSLLGAYFTVATSIGDSAFKNSGIKSISCYNVKLIGAEAFYNCSNLTAFSSSYLSSLGSNSFYGCYELTSVNLGKISGLSANMFNGYSKLSSVIADSITSIGTNALKGTAITSVSYPVLSSVSEGAFSDCINLTTVTLPAITDFSISWFTGSSKITKFVLNGLTNLSVLSGELSESFPELNTFDASSLTVVPDGAFKDLTELANYKLPAATTLGDYAFYNTAIDKVSFGSVNSVGNYTFAKIKGITEVYLPSLSKLPKTAFDPSTEVISLTLKYIYEYEDSEILYYNFPLLQSFTTQNTDVIPDYYFSGLSELTTLSLGNNVTTIGAYAFDGCDKLTTGNFGNANNISDDAFCGSSFEYLYLNSLEVYNDVLLRDLKSQLKLFSINKVEDLSNIYFGEFSSLETIYISSAKTIPDGCFKNVTSLKNVYNDYATTIGEEAFYNCTSLEKIVLDYATSIGKNAFYNCNALTYFNAENLKTLTENIFENCENLESVSMASLINLPENFTMRNFPNLKQFHISDTISSIPDRMFENCVSLTSVNFSSVKTVGDYAFYNTALSSFTFTNVTSIGDYAFYGADFTSLTDIPCTDIGVGAFSNCDKITKATFKELSNIPAELFENCTALKTFTSSAIDIKVVGDRAFKNTALTDFDLDYLSGVDVGDESFRNSKLNFNVRENFVFKSIGDYAFEGCTLKGNNIVMDTLSSVGVGGFNGFSFDFLTLPNVTIINDIPDGCITLVGSLVRHCADIETTGTVCTYANSKLADYCLNNGIDYLEFNKQNAFKGISAEYLTQMNSSVNVDAFGFDLTYIWYGTDNLDLSASNELFRSKNSTEKLLDENSSELKFNDYKYYYCDVVSYENGRRVTMQTPLIKNAFKFVEALDDTVVIDNDNPMGSVIYSNSINSEDVLNHLYLEEGECDIIPSYENGKIQSYGTGTYIDVYAGDTFVKTYVLIMYGDVNGDGYVDVLDSSKLYNYVYNLEYTYKDQYCREAMDLNGDGSSTIYDIQLMQNKIV